MLQEGCSAVNVVEALDMVFRHGIYVCISIDHASQLFPSWKSVCRDEKKSPN